MQLVTGNKFRKICDYVLDESGFYKNDIHNETPIFFIKTDFINLFFEDYKPNFKYKIISHNSDFPLTEKIKPFLDDENLICWFGQNVCYSHNKLFSIPIGIANEIWPHGDEEIIFNTISKQNLKKNLIHCSFDIQTNFFERIRCVNSMTKNNLKMNNREKFPDYLNSLSKSLFTLSPNGNGIDCHKLWEALYLKTIPIVTNSINVSFYSHLPILIIDSWENFDILNINEELYNIIINKHNYDLLSFNYYKEKIINKF